MVPITWPEFGDIHPFAPADQTVGYRQMIDDLEAASGEITGYAAVSLQPNAGSQGEYAGLLAIRAYHRSNGDDRAHVCLIPSSAHGTNAASAVMAGMDVVVVPCDEGGNVDLDDVRAKIDEYGERLAALMITYPSTHGVFETGVVGSVRPGPRRRRSGLRRRREPQRARRSRPTRPFRGRREPPEPAQDVLHPARRWRTRRRPDRRRCTPRPVPARAPARPTTQPSARSRRHPTARRASCRSRGCTSR